MRWVIRVIIGIMVLALLAVAALFLMPSDQIARLLARQVEAATGAQLQVTGAIRPTLWPEPGITLNGVSLSAPERTPVLQAESVSVGVDSDALWGGGVRVRTVTFNSPVIQLVRTADGAVNWDFAPGKLPPAQSSDTGATAPATAGTEPGPAADAGSDAGTDAVTEASTGLTLDEGTIRNGRVSFSDEATGQTWQADALDLTLRLPASGSGQVDAAFFTSGEAVQVAATIDNLTEALAGAVTAMTLEASAGASSASFKEPGAADGQIAAHLKSPGELARRYGVALSDLPAGLGRDLLDVAGQVTWTADRSLHLRDGRIQADENAMTGAFDLVTVGERPKLTARIASERLSFDPPSAPAGAAPAKPGTAAKAANAAKATKATAPSRGWSTARIDAGALGLLDAVIRLEAGTITASGQTLSPVSGTLTIDRARAVFDIARLGAMGGTISGNFIVNNRKGLSVGGDLVAKGADLGAIARMAGYDRLTGRGGARFKFLSAGNSVEALMKRLDGSGALSMSDAQIRGIDLGRALTDLDPAALDDAAVTPIDRLTASFAIARGVLSNDDLLLVSPAATVTGRGIVDLGGRTLDYQIQPKAVAAGRNVRVPLLVTGPWENPSFRLDLESVAAEELKRQEDRLRARAERKLAEELGVDPADGQALEDAARQKLQDEALKGLGKLLGGD